MTCTTTPGSYRMARILIWMGTAGLILIMAGAAAQYLLDLRDARRFPPPGALVAAGTYRLHLHEMGTGHGGPTVILDAGGGSFSAQWGWLQPEVAQFARVVAYDRPGLGWSESPGQPLDGQEIVEHLRAALELQGIPGPYILVGHSFGSVMIRTFAQRFPEEVVGLVHVDPRYLRMEDIIGPEVVREGNRMELLLPLAARLGLARLFNRAGAIVGELPEPQAAQGRAFFAATRHLSAMAREWSMSNRTVDRLAKSGEDLGDLPNIVLSSGTDDSYFHGERRARLTASQAAIAALSSKGEQRTIPGADHYTIMTRESYAREIVGAVHEIVADTYRLLSHDPIRLSGGKTHAEAAEAED